MKLPKLDYGGKPVFWARNVCPDRAPWDRGRCAVFNRLNAIGSGHGGAAISLSYGGDRIIGSPQLCHTFDDYFPEKEFGKTHPEYYALIKGKRVPGPGGQLCLSNPEVVEVAWRKMQQFILADEADAARRGAVPPAWYDFSYNDNYGVCECEKCQKIIKEERAISGLLVRALYELGTRLKKFRPNLYLTTIAYWQNEDLPAKARPPENLIVRLCNTAQNYVTPISAPGSAEFRKKVHAWGGVAKLGFWEYGITFYDAYYEFMPALPNEFIMEEQYRYYRDHHAIAAFVELEHSNFSDMHEMKRFLLAKLFEDPGQSVEKLRQLFLDRYFGPTAKYIDEYRRTLWKAAKKHNSQCFTYNMIPAFVNYFDLQTATKCDELLAEAQQVAGDDPVLARRVRRARLNLDNMILVYFRSLLKEHLASGDKRENFPFDWEKVKARYRAERIEALNFYFAHNPDYIKNWTETVDRRLTMMGNLPLVFPKEKIPPEWIEVTACHANAPLDRRPDPESPIGFTSKVDISKKPGYHDLPMGGGGYDNATMKETSLTWKLKASDVPGPGYHWYRTRDFVPLPAGVVFILNDWHFQVPMGLAFAASNRPGQRWYCCFSIKFAGPRYPHNGKGEPGIYIDRAFLIPAGMPFTLGKSILIDGKAKK